VTDIANDALRLFVERIERIEDSQRELGADKKDVYAEAKATGYDTKIMREVIRLRRMERHARQERDAMLQLYGSQLGLFD